jgi:hypothetical protein
MLVSALLIPPPDIRGNETDSILQLHISTVVEQIFE